MAAETREWSTIACCECGAPTTIDPDGTYRVIPDGTWRWRTNPETSEVWQEQGYAYICDPCWELLPDE